MIGKESNKALVRMQTTLRFVGTAQLGRCAKSPAGLQRVYLDHILIDRLDSWFLPFVLTLALLLPLLALLAYLRQELVRLALDPSPCDPSPCARAGVHRRQRKREHAETLATCRDP